MFPRLRIAPLALALAPCVAPALASDADHPYTVFNGLAGNAADEVVFGSIPISDQLIMIYQHQLGTYPWIDFNTHERTNGGVPQAVNMSLHLAEVERDVLRLVPEGFSGYVCIDYEGWTPWWDDIVEMYKVCSREYVLERYPDISAADLERKARREFEEGAQDLFRKTILRCKSLRPDARWGFWSYPRARYEQLEADWLWPLCDVFYPSVYMRYAIVPDDQPLALGEEHLSWFIEERLEGNVAYARELAGERPVLAFGWCRYTKRNPDQFMRLRFLRPSDAALMLESARDYGADGVVLWDNIAQSSSVPFFQTYLDETLGPILIRIADESLRLFRQQSTADGYDGPSRRPVDEGGNGSSGGAGSTPPPPPPPGAEVDRRPGQNGGASGSTGSPSRVNTTRGGTGDAVNRRPASGGGG